MLAVDRAANPASPGLDAPAPCGGSAKPEPGFEPGTCRSQGVLDSTRHAVLRRCLFPHRLLPSCCRVEARKVSRRQGELPGRNGPNGPSCVPTAVKVHTTSAPSYGPYPSTPDPPIPNGPRPHFTPSLPPPDLPPPLPCSISAPPSPILPSLPRSFPPPPPPQVPVEPTPPAPPPPPPPSPTPPSRLLPRPLHLSPPPARPSRGPSRHGRRPSRPGGKVPSSGSRRRASPQPGGSRAGDPQR